jgi:hypothetical protein
MQNLEARTTAPSGDRVIDNSISASQASIRESPRVLPEPESRGAESQGR